jgi:hypothetical protein
MSDKMEMDFIKSTCKIGQAENCCRYLVMGSGGFECGRLDDKLATTIDQRADGGQMVAVSKNCKGFGK